MYYVLVRIIVNAIVYEYNPTVFRKIFVSRKTVKEHFFKSIRIGTHIRPVQYLFLKSTLRVFLIIVK